MTAYPPEWYTDAELDAARAEAAEPDPWADTEPDVEDLTLWAKAAEPEAG